jgi:hypothetical protein
MDVLSWDFGKYKGIFYIAHANALYLDARWRSHVSIHIRSFINPSCSYFLGMTDGRNTMSMEHYIYRSQTSPSRPAFFGFGIKFGREDILKRFEDMGLTVMYELDTVYRDILAGMPNCDGKSEADIAAMPTMVRECRCRQLEENGRHQTICAEEKWSDYGNATCQARKFKTSWHPGWYVVRVYVVVRDDCRCSFLLRECR